MKKILQKLLGWIMLILTIGGFALIVAGSEAMLAVFKGLGLALLASLFLTAAVALISE